MGNNINNQKSVRNANRGMVLRLLRRKGSVSRVDIAKELGCNGTTITRIVRFLEGEGLVRDIGRAETRFGRPKQLLELDTSRGHVIGISIEPNGILGVLVDLKGTISARDSVRLSTSADLPEIEKIITEIVERLSKRVPSERILGVGAATFGMLNSELVVKPAPGFKGITGLDVKRLIDTHLGMTSRIVDATLAKARYAIWRNGSGGSGTFLLLNVGVGIGLAVAIDGKFVCVRNNHPGEFGHTMYDLTGELCACGRRGCLETVAAIPALERKTGLSFDEIVPEYSGGAESVASIVNKASEALGVAIGGLVNIFTPDEIVLSGEMLRLGNGYVEKLEKRMREVAFDVFLDGLGFIGNEYDEESAALGAALNLLEDFFDGVIIDDFNLNG